MLVDNLDTVELLSSAWRPNQPESSLIYIYLDTTVKTKVIR